LHKKGFNACAPCGDRTKEQAKDLIKEIERFENAIKTAEPRNLKEFWDALRANKIEVNPTINKAGKMQGYRVAFGGQNFKASEVWEQVHDCEA
jgi:hypothetical protein